MWMFLSSDFAAFHTQLFFLHPLPPFVPRSYLCWWQLLQVPVQPERGVFQRCLRPVPGDDRWQNMTFQSMPLRRAQLQSRVFFFFFFSPPLPIIQNGPDVPVLQFSWMTLLKELQLRKKKTHKLSLDYQGDVDAHSWTKRERRKKTKARKCFGHQSFLRCLPMTFQWMAVFFFLKA